MNYQSILASMDYNWKNISERMYAQYGLNSTITEDNRIIFTVKRIHGEIEEIPSTLDGSIFNMNTNTLISKMGHYYNTKEPLAISDDMKTEEILDGTAIGLYNFNDKWILRSKNGYDISNMSFYGSSKYGDMFKDCEHQIDYTKLDKSCSYSFIMKHNDIHHFSDEKYPANLTHTETFNLETGEPIDMDIGIPKPKKYDFTTYENLTQELSNSIRQYRTDGTVFYGIVVRLKNKNFTYYSELYALISRLLYTNKYNRELKASGVQRNDFMILVAFMNPKDRANFIGLFPSSKNSFKQLDDNCANLINIIFERIKNRTLNIRDEYYSICYQFCRMNVFINDKKLLREYVIGYHNLIHLAKLFYKPINIDSSILAI